jgi:hypothetical protein
VHRSVRLELGTQSVSTTAEDFQRMLWTPDHTSAAIRVGQPRGTGSFAVEETDSPWALLRVLARFNVVEHDPDGGVYRWLFDHDSISDLPRRIRESDRQPVLTDPLTVHIKPSGPRHPFAGLHVDSAHVNGGAE